jgi:hypothetical protein
MVLLLYNPNKLKIDNQKGFWAFFVIVQRSQILQVLIQVPLQINCLFRSVLFYGLEKAYQHQFLKWDGEITEKEGFVSNLKY